MENTTPYKPEPIARPVSGEPSNSFSDPFIGRGPVRYIEEPIKRASLWELREPDAIVSSSSDLPAIREEKLNELSGTIQASDPTVSSSTSMPSWKKKKRGSSTTARVAKGALNIPKPSVLNPIDKLSKLLEATRINMETFIASFEKMLKDRSQDWRGLGELLLRALKKVSVPHHQRRLEGNIGPVAMGIFSRYQNRPVSLEDARTVVALLMASPYEQIKTSANKRIARGEHIEKCFPAILGSSLPEDWTIAQQAVAALLKNKQVVDKSKESLVGVMLELAQRWVDAGRPTEACGVLQEIDATLLSPSQKSTMAIQQVACAALYKDAENYDEARRILEVKIAVPSEYVRQVSEVYVACLRNLYRGDRFQEATELLEKCSGYLESMPDLTNSIADVIYSVVHHLLDQGNADSRRLALNYVRTLSSDSALVWGLWWEIIARSSNSQLFLDAAFAFTQSNRPLQGEPDQVADCVNQFLKALSNCKSKEFLVLLGDMKFHENYLRIVPEEFKGSLALQLVDQGAGLAKKLPPDPALATAIYNTFVTIPEERRTKLLLAVYEVLIRNPQAATLNRAISIICSVIMLMPQPTNNDEMKRRQDMIRGLTAMFANAAINHKESLIEFITAMARCPMYPSDRLVIARMVAILLDEEVTIEVAKLMKDALDCINQSQATSSSSSQESSVGLGYNAYDQVIPFLHHTNGLLDDGCHSSRLMHCIADLLLALRQIPSSNAEDSSRLEKVVHQLYPYIARSILSGSDEMLKEKLGHLLTAWPDIPRANVNTVLRALVSSDAEFSLTEQNIDFLMVRENLTNSLSKHDVDILLALIPKLLLKKDYVLVTRICYEVLLDCRNGVSYAESRLLGLAKAMENAASRELFPEAHSLKDGVLAMLLESVSSVMLQPRGDIVRFVQCAQVLEIAARVGKDSESACARIITISAIMSSAMLVLTHHREVILGIEAMTTTLESLGQRGEAQIREMREKLEILSNQPYAGLALVIFFTPDAERQDRITDTWKKQDASMRMQIATLPTHESVQGEIDYGIRDILWMCDTLSHGSSRIPGGVPFDLVDRSVKMWVANMLKVTLWLIKNDPHALEQHIVNLDIAVEQAIARPCICKEAKELITRVWQDILVPIQLALINEPLIHRTLKGMLDNWREFRSRNGLDAPANSINLNSILQQH